MSHDSAHIIHASEHALAPFSALCGVVTGRDGAKLGAVTELMVEAATGRIGYAALASGGVLGVGEKLYAVPWACFTIEPVTHALSLPLTAAELHTMPDFDKDAWPTEADARFLALCGEPA